MLHNLEWLQTGQVFPPKPEVDRLERYKDNMQLFEGDHFDTHIHKRMYHDCITRIRRVIGNFESYVSFATLFNYQRLSSLKMADLVCGEYPTITGGSEEATAALQTLRDESLFDSKLYAAVIDISRYGDAVLRAYQDDFGKKTFTVWDPKEWFPIVSQDGTNTILKHVLCWRENTSLEPYNPHWLLHAQIHGTGPDSVGKYEHRVYEMDGIGGTIKKQISSALMYTGFSTCAVIHLKSFTVSNTVYGYDDYMIIDSILAEIMTRVGQISVILDKHADPNITGPATMLEVDPITGERRLNSGKFFAVSMGEDQPQYMVWEGQLQAAFSQLELLFNQLYILSEMGAALLGEPGSGSQAISGTAMRFKMVNPLSKARRISNSLTLPIRNLLAALSDDLPVKSISIVWSDGLPDDPRENLEMVRLATGATAIMPLDRAIVEFFGRSSEEATQWVKDVEAAQLRKEEALAKVSAKGSDTGLKSFHKT